MKRTWSAQVLLLIASGIVASAQIGKAIITIPLIGSELSLGLDLAGLIVASFAILGAITGICAGVVVGRLGVRCSLITGMTARRSQLSHPWPRTARSFRGACSRACDARSDLSASVVAVGCGRAPALGFSRRHTALPRCHGDSRNAGSIALHRRLGFRVIGTFESVGFKLGKWVDTVLMRRALADGDLTPAA
jgi:MFS family permease